MSAAKNKFIQMFKRFTMDEISQSVILQFPETDLETIEAKYEKINVETVLKEVLVCAESWPEIEFKYRISMLELIRINNSRSKTWYTWKLNSTDPEHKNPEMVYKLKQFLSLQFVDAEVYVLYLFGKYLIKITRLMNKCGVIKANKPLYFQLFPHQPYLFCSHKIISSLIIRGIVDSLGYDRYRQTPVHGVNVNDLLATMRLKDAKARLKESKADRSEVSNQISIPLQNDPSISHHLLQKFIKDGNERIVVVPVHGYTLPQIPSIDLD